MAKYCSSGHTGFGWGSNWLERERETSEKCTRCVWAREGVKAGLRGSEGKRKEVERGKWKYKKDRNREERRARRYFQNFSSEECKKHLSVQR